MKKDPKWLDYMEDRYEERAKNEEYFIKKSKQKPKNKK
jgi:hypothetical protein